MSEGYSWHARRWAWLLTLAALVSLLALGPLLLRWLSWQRIRSQLRTAIEYEDERSLASDVEVVKSLQGAENEEWIRARSAEASLGLPSPLPAPNLLPLPEPAQIVKLSARGADLVEATVARAFADSAGVRYEFELTQRYRRRSADVWERLPPDETRLLEQITWFGRRLIAKYPVLDAPWMEKALPRIDAYLVAACLFWECPDGPAGNRLVLFFSGRLAELAPPVGTRRPTQVATTKGGADPIIFELAAGLDRYPAHATLASPQLSGYPHDEAASAILTRATTVSLLAYLAGELANSHRENGDYFFDALVARAETRLGISPGGPDSTAIDGTAVELLPHHEIAPREYVPPEFLWPHRASETREPLRGDMALRRQALAFMNFTLASQPAAKDGDLLRTLRQHNSLEDWISAGLGLDGKELIQEWDTAVVASFAASAALPWQQLNGLAYACDNGAWLMRDGQAQLLPVDKWRSWLVPDGLSGDGRLLAVLVPGTTGQPQSATAILDLSDKALQVIGPGSFLPLGWSADGELAYLDPDPQADPGEFQRRLMVCDPVRRLHRRVMEQPVFPLRGRLSQITWSRDRARLALTLRGSGAGVIGAVISLSTGGLTPIPGHGSFSPALSPDGSDLAYIVGLPWGQPAEGQVAIELLDMESRATRPLVTFAALDPDGVPLDIAYLKWSPDGTMLSFLAEGRQFGSRLFTVQRDGSQLRQRLAVPPNVLQPIGFSADSRYLAAIDHHSGDGFPRLSLLDHLNDPDTTSVVGQEFYSANLAVWSPQGHLIAAAGPGGLYVADPATGKSRWLAPGPCSSLAWYALR